MNKLTTTLLIAGTLVFTGCKKWLDVTPEGLTTKDEMFESQKGFRDALTGAYIDLKSSDAYGGAMTWGAVEFLARNWDVSSPDRTDLNALVNANYLDAGAKKTIDAIYAKEYKVVADVNSILGNIDAKKGLFQDNNYALIKGEALTLRAFAHFDVLRMFGPMPDSVNTTPILPYVTEVSKDIVPLSGYDDFAKQILADLDQAELSLKDVDPITQFSLSELNPLVTSVNNVPVVSDDYYMYRQVRMNYYAVLALKARVNNWLKTRGDSYRANAVKYAQMVIDAKDHLGAPTYKLGERKDVVNGDATFTSEHIAAVIYNNLNDVVTKTFGETGTLVRYDLSISDGFYYLNNLFPVTERTTDARFVGMWQYKITPGQGQYIMYKKYIQREPYPNNQIPLLRLSEMYLILTECALTKADAENSYRIYCDKKGIPFATGFSASGWEADRRNKMIREYVREFYAEGQTFFTYKRYNVTTLPVNWMVSQYLGSPKRYIVPKPDREINYHNK
ncbi:MULTISPECIES: RagB/SusD family nutrient uptake outer membrane protein [Niastella]|uniref:RagB/SusD family nutrient uptake outer membrane protein n=1 Tax=Niastella soli TaxID=2821487 RepID=A0ABS3YZ29_9BACT|nr:RagB/SusD family nutrient uptake outer membrane protein [Niastella soli]MBO9202993.1 RagB/SusD family nutrient uptake outer membrane protein [Niastella soli]